MWGDGIASSRPGHSEPELNHEQGLLIIKTMHFNLEIKGLIEG